MWAYTRLCNVLVLVVLINRNADKIFNEYKILFINYVFVSMFTVIKEYVTW